MTGKEVAARLRARGDDALDREAAALIETLSALCGQFVQNLVEATALMEKQTAALHAATMQLNVRALEDLYYRKPEGNA